VTLAAQRAPSELVGDVERLLADLETLGDPVAAERATAVIAALLELYGTGLARMVEEIGARDDGTLAAAFADDDLIAHLLLLHGLHPVPLPERVYAALDEVRPYLESHGGNVELVEVEEPVVRLRMQGSCSGCPSSSVTLKLAIEDAIHKAAPEIEEVIAEDVVAAESPPLLAGGPVLSVAQVPGDGAGDGASDGVWTTVGGLRELDRAVSVVKTVGGRPLLFLKVGARVLAYSDRCASCGSALGDATVRSTRLTCGACGNRYDVLRAGRCLDEPELHLDPVPLLIGDDDLVRVALAVPAR
jgi:Fe-S cluster biogenesis protein NfuA/nitrite reductase/ring-hydroxylating ferredoxin subunit